MLTDPDAPPSLSGYGKIELLDRVVVFVAASEETVKISFLRDPLGMAVAEDDVAAVGTMVVA